MANTPKADKGTFILRSDFYPQVQLLTREQRGDLLTAIFAYTSDEDLPAMDGVTTMCFEFIKASIDFYAVRYDAQCQKNRENGRKGGRPKKAAGNNENQPDNDETGQFEENPLESEKTERFLEQPTATDETERINEKPDGNDGTDRFTEQPTESEKTERSKKNHYTDSDSDNSTHTVKDKMEGGTGETIARDRKINPDIVHNLIAWISANVPTVAAMAEPLTEQNIVWMLRKYSVEDIQRIIQAMHNKRAFENISAYATFINFAKYDKELAERKNAKSSGPKPYTYDEVCDLVGTHRHKMSDFEAKEIDGVRCWFRKIDLIRANA